MSSQNHSFGTAFSWGGVAIAGLTSINGIELSIDMVDSTTHQAADYTKTVIPGLVDPGEVVLEGGFDYTDANGQVALMADAQARTNRTGVITFPAVTGATWTFSGYITKIRIGDAPIDGKIPFSCSIKPTGKPVFAVATSAGLTTTFLSVSNSGAIVPAPAQATLEYTINFLTAVASITLTPTAAAGVITITANGVSQVVTSGQASTAIALGAAGSITNATISVQETNKAPRVYTLHLVRA
jgi:hypothetical protein